MKSLLKKKNKISKKPSHPFISHEELQKRLQIFSSFSKSDNQSNPEPTLSHESLPDVFKQTIEKFNEIGLKYYKDKLSETEEDNETGENNKHSANKINQETNQEFTKLETEKQDVQKGKKISRKKEKEFFKSKISQLKVVVERPDLVESWDVSAPDPLLLIHLKSAKSSVSVPKHWSQKKRFLQTKRGFFKRPFRLPDFIEATGISKLRDPLAEISSVKMIKQKLKERMNPRLGKIDIDYETLHDAFFKYQTKPKLTMFGDIYYEGKEEDQKMRAFRPGKVSSELRLALGISENAPLPWLSNMHKYGPPPGYPNMKLSGFDFGSFKKDKRKDSDDDQWEWINENYRFGAIIEDKPDEEEFGYEIENQMNEDGNERRHQLNEENPFFLLENFEPANQINR